MSALDKRIKDAFLKPGARRWSVYSLLVPIVSVLLALVLGSVLLLFIGINPLEAYWYLIFSNFSNTYNIAEVLVKATPIALTGLAFTFAFRTGLFNIGGEGQMFAGAMAAVFVGLKTGHLPAFVTIGLCLAAAIVAGGIWGFIPGVLKGVFGSSEIIVTIMFNYVAVYLLSFLVDKPLREAAGFYPQTDMIGENAFLPFLIQNTRLHIGLVVAIILSILVYVVLWKTPLGFRLRAVGYNPDGAEYAGINIRRNMILAMVISGALAGVAGFTEINGIHHRMMDNFSRNVGFDGIAASLLGGATPGGVFVSSILLGMLQTGASAMQRGVGVPANIVSIIQALIIILVLAGNMMRPKLEMRLKVKRQEREEREEREARKESQGYQEGGTDA
ncbi:MAG: ABC transporter permease [Acidaminobacter sp.]|uniref:ABC transporter permease n=1 Tax=Acidaminobacter sp. TaxID=1872102 RepID=UPI00137F02B1|nr:ABC transporter permease [Acidaminobacter sp.]MZQ96103.1 ABC transporter permease [Acidaminobacter sp.]